MGDHVPHCVHIADFTDDGWMEVMPGDNVETPIWNVYQEIIEKREGFGPEVIGHRERFAFYEEAKKAYAIIATGETALYANVMLQKGVI